MPNLNGYNEIVSNGETILLLWKYFFHFQMMHARKKEADIWNSGITSRKENYNITYNEFTYNENTYYA